MSTLRLDGSICECARPTGQCVKGDLDRCPAEDDDLYDPEDDESMEAECGRWHNGGLSSQCRLAGTEWCDWDCPIGESKPKRK